MELRFKGQFNRDIDINNRPLLEEIKDAIANVKKCQLITSAPAHVALLGSTSTGYAT